MPVGIVVQSPALVPSADENKRNESRIAAAPRKIFIPNNLQVDLPYDSEIRDDDS